MPKLIAVDKDGNIMREVDLSGNFDSGSSIQEKKVESPTLSVSTIKDLRNFLKEFDMEVSARMLNTLVHTEDVKSYLVGYAQLTGRDYLSLAEKMISPEFKNIEKVLEATEVEKKINKRFRLYYGSAGTGKTTRALSEADDNVIVMHENMTPKELLSAFDFDDGKATFEDSAFATAMKEGKPIVLDEVNLAPFETIRYLQGLLDNKEVVTEGVNTYEIKEGFEVIGTMNEEILGSEQYLPEPLIDRASEIKRFVLTEEMLYNIAINPEGE